MSDCKDFKSTYKRVNLEDSPKSGGQGTTFKAVKVASDDKSLYIVKLLNNQKDNDRRSRMRRECVSLETLNHRGIPKIIDSNTEYFKDLSYKLFIVMELIPGITLSEFANETPIFSFTKKSLKPYIEFYCSLLNIIQYCHDNYIIHRDLKPDNIILRNGNLEQPVIVDFGQSFNNLEIDFKTPIGQIMGNRFLYLPELSKNSSNKWDCRSDLTMASGLFLYFLAGKEPGHLMDENNLLPHQKLIDKRVVANSDKTTIIMLNALFDRAFQPNINYRFQSVSEIKEAINKIMNDEVPGNLSEQLKQFNLLRQSETKANALRINAKLDDIFHFVYNVSQGALQRFDGTIGVVAGKVIKNIPQAIGGYTFTYFDKANPTNKISFKIIGQLIGNELVLIGEIIEHALDDNVVLENGESLQRINTEDSLTKVENAITNFILNKVILKMS
jgi:serine/threonine protein kinase